MEWFKMRTDWDPLIQKLTDEEVGRIMRAVYAYVTKGEEKEYSGREGIFTAFILQTLKRDIEKYETGLAEEARRKEKSREHARHAAEARWKREHGEQEAASSGHESAYVEHDTASDGHEEASGGINGHPGARHKNKNKSKNIESEKEKEKEREREAEEGDTYSCSEPPEEASELPSAEIPLNDGSEFPVYLRDVEEYAALYPAVDVVQELRKIRGWCLANPSRRKTRRGVKAFINSWLCREQDKGRARDEPPENPFLAYARGEKEIGKFLL